MIPWIQVYSNLIKHPKTYALADELKLTSKDASPNAVAAGLMLSLWLWAAQNASNGDLSQCSTRAIAEAAEYKKKPEAFVDALIKVRFLDPDKKLHDWDEHASMLMDSIKRSKDNNAKRQQRHRDKNKPEKNTQSNTSVAGGSNVTGNVTNNESNVTGNVTNNESNASTIPYHTKPNQTIPNLYVTTGGTNLEDGIGDAPEGAPVSNGAHPFTAFWEAYPKKSSKQRDEAYAAWKHLNPNPDGVTHIMAQLEAWKKSEQWTEQGGRFVTPAANFLDPEGDYLRKLPVPGKQTTTKGASGELGSAELDAIRRALKEAEA